MNNFLFLKEYRIYIGFVIVFLVMFIFLPKEGKFKYEYQKARPWIYETLYAPIDIPILKTEAELSKEIEERSSMVLPYYIYNQKIVDNGLKQLTRKAMDEDVPTKVLDVLLDSYQYVCQRGIFVKSEEQIQSKDGVVLIQRGKRATETPMIELFDANKALQYIKTHLGYELTDVNLDSLFSKVDIMRYIVPNLRYDRQTTELLHKNAVDYISPTKGVLYAGQLIVTEGEIITTEIEQLLDSYKAEYDLSYGYTGSSIFLYLAHLIMTIIILGLVFLIILFYNPFLFRQYRTMGFLLLMPLSIFLLSIAIRDTEGLWLSIIPYTVFALYMVAFFKAKFVFPLYIASLLPLLLIAENGLELFFMNVSAGAVGIISFQYFNRGWHQFLSAFFIFLTLSLTYISFRFMEEGSFNALNWTNFVFYMCNSFFVVAAYPVVYLLEKLFGFLSVASLKDYADTNNNLLQDLAKKAPGSFQHSLQVANLAEAAAREIGADSVLIRVGALYHDIGKMFNPQCFIENQAVGVDYHKELSPIESAQEIIKHMEEGVEVAQKNKLPEVIIDFIRTHHGKSQTLYFYNQYCNAGGDPEDMDKFTYPGMLPTTKEHVILMMADIVEAASRTLKSYTNESIAALVDNVLDSKLKDMQMLSEADISLKEINIVKNVFKTYIQQIYHMRIAYPERKK